MTSGSFFENPILNSPYSEPDRYHSLDAEGQPLDEPPRQGRRRSEFITPVPKPRKRKQKNNARQGKLGLQNDDGVSSDEQEYNPTPIINEIRRHLAAWRALPQSSWGVTPATARLLNHWRHHQFQGIRPFFCQVEAVEAVIWLTEVAKAQKQYSHIWEHVLGANEQANPELLRIAMKMAAGAGKRAHHESARYDSDRSLSPRRRGAAPIAGAPCSNSGAGSWRHRRRRSPIRRWCSR